MPKSAQQFSACLVAVLAVAVVVTGQLCNEANDKLPPITMFRRPDPDTPTNPSRYGPGVVPDLPELTVQVETINGPPVAVDDAASTQQGTPVLVPVVGNDSDPDGDALTVIVVTQPPNGEAVNNGDGTTTYTPDAGFSGTDQYRYTVGDGTGRNDTATVTVTVEPPVNQPPIAADDSATTDVEVPVTVPSLSNDADPDDDPLTVVSNTDPSHGSVADNGDGTFTYTPNSGFSGTDTFEYEITDGNGGYDSAKVTVIVFAPTGAAEVTCPKANPIQNFGPLLYPDPETTELTEPTVMAGNNEAYTATSPMIVPVWSDGNTAVFETYQYFMDKAISWQCFEWIQTGTEESPLPVAVKFESGDDTSPTKKRYFEAQCINNVATIRVFGHDGQFPGDGVVYPKACAGSCQTSTIGYKLEIPCQVGCGGEKPTVSFETGAPATETCKHSGKPGSQPGTIQGTTAAAADDGGDDLGTPTAAPDAAAPEATSAPTSAPVAVEEEDLGSPSLQCASKANGGVTVKYINNDGAVVDDPPYLPYPAVGEDPVLKGVSSSGNLVDPLHEMVVPFYSTAVNQETGLGTVWFNGYQYMKQQQISWMCFQWDNASGDNVARKVEGPKTGEAGVRSIEAQCKLQDNGKYMAEVRVFAHDGQFTTSPGVPYPKACAGSCQTGVVGYVVMIECFTEPCGNKANLAAPSGDLEAGASVGDDVCKDQRDAKASGGPPKGKNKRRQV